MADASLAFEPTAGVRLRRLPTILSAQSVVVLLAIVLGLVLLGGSLLNDPDTQWHIAVGRQIWSSGALPTSDTYSHTFFGTPWIAKEWISQLLLFAADELGGWRGVVVLTAAAIALAFAMLHDWLRRHMQPTHALALLLVALMLAMPHFLARPHMLVLPVIVAWMIGLLAAAEEGRAPHPAFALLMVLWANMHGSFPLGLGMAGLSAAEAVWLAPAAQRVGLAARWALFLALATAATVTTPYGWRGALVALKMEGNTQTMNYVAEWRPMAFNVTGCLALAMLAGFLVVLAGEWRRTIFRIIAILLLGAMMLRHDRFVSLFGTLAPLLAADTLGRRFGASRAAAKTGAATRGAVAALMAAVLVAVAIVTPAPAARMRPEAAYNAAMAAGATGPVYNDYDFGGFLMARGVPTFVDGRTDQLFLGSFLGDLTQAVDSKDDTAFAALLARYGIGWALVRSGSNDARHLAHLPSWQLIHSDEIASVFIRR